MQHVTMFDLTLDFLMELVNANATRQYRTQLGICKRMSESGYQASSAMQTSAALSSAPGVVIIATQSSSHTQDFAIQRAATGALYLRFVRKFCHLTFSGTMCLGLTLSVYSELYTGCMRENSTSTSFCCCSPSAAIVCMPGSGAIWPFSKLLLSEVLAAPWPTCSSSSFVSSTGSSL